MKKETLVNRYLDHLELEQLHQEGFSSTARKSGEETGKKLKPFRFFAGKAIKGVGKAAIGTTKVAGKVGAGYLKALYRGNTDKEPLNNGKRKK